MRIAVATLTSRQVGGVETYLAHVIPELARQGHEVGFWCEIEDPADRAPVPVPEGAPSWSAASLGGDRSVEALASWRPDVVYAHGVGDPRLEAMLCGSGPSVMFIHDYHGTCVSGSKMFSFPSPASCTRTLGLGCLARYFPRRCGGRSPLTMARLYRRQKARLALLPRYAAIVTGSEYMREEYRRHGVPDGRLHCLRLPVAGASGAPDGRVRGRSRRASLDACTLLYFGRMERLKGGELLLSVLPAVRHELGIRLRVIMAGDGSAREVWQRKAQAVQRAHDQIAIDFPGWLDSPAQARVFAESDLLVVPTLSPEPSALVGLEVARAGVPAVAFGVGGIPEWLEDGVNGCLVAPPVSGAGLARGIVACLRDPTRYATMSQNALAKATDSRRTMDHHVTALTSILEAAVA